MLVRLRGGMAQRVERLARNHEAVRIRLAPSNGDPLAGLTLTRTAPIRAVAYWTRIHSAQFGAQMPTRSPLPMPATISPNARRSDRLVQLAIDPPQPLATAHHRRVRGPPLRGARQARADRLADKRNVRDPAGIRDGICRAGGGAHESPSASRPRSSTRRILPLTVFGSSSTKWISRGYLYGAVCSLTKPWISFANSRLPT